MFKYKRDIIYLFDLFYMVYIYLINSLKAVLINLFL